MSNSTVNLAVFEIGKGARPVTLPVDGGSHIYAGTMMSQLSATKMLVPGTTSTAGRCVGVATHEQDASAVADAIKRCAILSDGIFAFKNSSGDPCSEALCDFGQPVYMEDDHTIAATSSSGSLMLAGYYAGLEPDGKVRVLIRLEADTPDADLLSLEARLSADESVTDAGADASLETRISTEEAARSTAVASATTVYSTADASIVTRFSTADASVVTRFSSGDASIDLRLSALWSYVSF